MRNVMHFVGLLMLVLAAITGLALAVAGEQQGEEQLSPPHPQGRITPAQLLQYTQNALAQLLIGYRNECLHAVCTRSA
jgi:hypothetical protein